MKRLVGRDVICFANDWAGDPLSKQHIVRSFARDNRVLWVESLGNRAPRLDRRDLTRLVSKLARFRQGLREVQRNLWLLSPLAIPAYHSPLARAINALVVTGLVKRAMHQLGFDRPLLYTFVPASAWVIGRLGEEQSIYHCVDEYSAFAGAGQEIAELERQLCQRADLTIVSSQSLLERRRPFARRIALVRHGVDHRHFARALLPETDIPDELARLPKPVLGFHGLIAEWVDSGLIRRIAERFPHASVVLIGDLRIDRPIWEGLPNLHLLGRRPYQDLPRYCRGFDVALLPFVVDELTICASPLKLREYLAAGLPVVATSIPEARLFGDAVQVAENDEAFFAAILHALARPGPRSERSELVADQTWDHQIERIHQLLT